MNNTIRTMAALLLLILIATTMRAQESVSILAQRADTVILRHVDVNYLRIGWYSNILGNTSVVTRIERVSTKDLIGKSYENYSFVKFPGTKLIEDLFQSLFSKERAQQLENLNISIGIRISPAEDGKILHIDFSIRGTDNENSPLQLSELYELEQRLKTDPKLRIKFYGSGEIVNHGEAYGYGLEFKRLYK